MSSSDSWAGGARAAGDIIDLDRFMRSARPSHAPHAPQTHHAPLRQVPRSGLVVDGGGARKPGSSGQLSRDSGLSDGSYARRRRRPRRRASGESASRSRSRAPAAASASAASLRAFRTACSRALRDQQHAIARVAQLCERLAARAPSSASTSSRSTRDPRRKDKHRTDECKTYKIIMTKLDELNRLFNARARSPAPRPLRPARPDTTSGSVSVSDKLVATEPEPRVKTVVPLTQIPTKHMEAKWKPESSASRLVERAVGSESVRSGALGERSATLGERSATLGERSRRCSRLATLRAVTNAPTLDIAPHDALPRRTRESPNIVTESVVKCESSNEDSSSSVCDPHCGFDLDNPVHLYAQAKRLQALHATTHRRARSSDADGRGAGAGPRRSLCGACRGYWRSLRHYLAAQIFCCPMDACPC
ncbi:uncharacterized protein LOC114366372 [Ostrinia furnacalis]|uniref:uncharacterized protein LOC114366372 n=1 Tax=Ostrinia furnacalis TaxID=93504 RepID=UPI00103DF7FA|nr:uncharacterized protein LOC114366372 [Ostrinia furnacalis]